MHFEDLLYDECREQSEKHGYEMGLMPSNVRSALIKVWVRAYPSDVEDALSSLDMAGFIADLFIDNATNTGLRRAHDALATAIKNRLAEYSEPDINKILAMYSEFETTGDDHES